MKRFLLILLFLSTILSNIIAAELPVGNTEDGNTIVSTSKKKLNIRKGAGTNYEIIAQLSPGEYAWVTDTESVSSGWVKINTGKNEGYIKTDYIQSANGNDYVEWCN
ncbi:MAG: SH3 domain-containing protein, partial [Muribaculaceae bacterium]|nr:SH3 domain-containing protein [Muribaculaceae bacterium]